ncbi:LOW QUALITY PROTEIN: protein-glutamine gamma-glutamyltransferase 5 [Coregonus clupeaformis]|uniref:LOW QUALITY PROTEIN: protein-glutamine gamma-glutamyltransferase 5 n=1 Tax=Coregonus clupeaformis TaxID=59861 RepID=UPI001BE0F0C4|nr:LOW QUALITY PROTEIN: protein-glutamine gamma-glutamyltransferase 5 [Coregonus clupeaformis]
MEELIIQFVNLELQGNHESHKTQGFSSKTLVVRRGAPFKVTLLLKGRAFNPQTDTLVFRVLLGQMYVEFPVTFSKQGSPSQWSAYFTTKGLNPKSPSLYISSPASSSVGLYSIQLHVLTQHGQQGYVVGDFILLCNPWCHEDAVHIPFEDQREEYVKNDSGLLYMGTPKNLESRPWSFDQYEPEILDICLKLLQVSPQHGRNWQKDYLHRADPVYLSRVVSAMINCEDDRGVLRGNWSGDFKNGVPPSKWTGSADILRQWAKSKFSPVKYGQCWVFAAVMCTVMRALGIPSRVITNFNSAHDTNGNLVIEEFYSETGKKLPHSKDSIWNFHVWVECWMTRPDLGAGFDGWQVLDPTPQERSGGIFCCGPAPVKAIRDRRVDLVYDIPFVYAAVNADIHTVIVKQGQVLSSSTDTERVGSLIVTKTIGSPRPQNITGDYKPTKAAMSSHRSRGARSTQGLSVSLSLLKVPAAGENISFTVMVTNMESVPKVLREHVNAQTKEYNHSPSDAFWEAHNIIRIAPHEAKAIHHQIGHVLYESLMGDDLVNLAVVMEDKSTQERVLASEEFNITSPQLFIQIADEDSIVPHKEHTALVVFRNPFSVPVSGVLTVAGSGLIEGKIHSRIHLLKPGGTVERIFSFTPRIVGKKMLQSTLVLKNNSTKITGYRMISVKAA